MIYKLDVEELVQEMVAKKWMTAEEAEEGSSEPEKYGFVDEEE